MSSKIILFFLAAVSLISCGSSLTRNVELENAFALLDEVMARQDELADIKEARIASLQALPALAGDKRALYDAYDVLFQEYHKWNVDSAYHYADLKATLADEIGSPELRCDAALDLSQQHLITCLYNESMSTLQSLDSAIVVSSGRLYEYLYLWYDIYHGLVQTTRYESLCREYREKEQLYLNLCRENITEESILFFNTQAKVMLPSGQGEEFIALASKRIEDGNTSVEDLARLHYWLGKAYQEMGDERMALLHTAISSRYDLTLPVKTYGSLILLMKLCYHGGDIKRAYSYATRCYIDAVDMSDSKRVASIAELLPDIIIQYEQYSAAKRRQIVLFLIMLLGLLSALSFALILLRGNLRRLHKANVEIAENAKKLQESNRIKDTYLGEFLSMFSEHISSLEKYRSTLRVVAKQKDFDILLQELRSDEFIDQERATLYDKFDKTFLELFPDFVEQLNALLLEDMHLGEGLPEGTLSNELRVFALMRLGVTEPARISKFLHLSSTTVYNYRVKLRNAAVCPRDEFESRLMHIGE